MKDIVSAKVVFLDTGVESCLNTRAGSDCHFFEPFYAGYSMVQLRLDWRDLDENGYPTLDADFYCQKTRKKQKLKGARNAAHHTKALPNAGRTYEWVFDDTALTFRVILAFTTEIIDRVSAGDSVIAEIRRAGEKVSPS